MSSEERALEQVRELARIIDRLNEVRGNVDDFRIDDYRDAGEALWAGQKRKRFVGIHRDAKADYEKISEQIEQAIRDCKSKQRSLASSISMVKHPLMAAQANAIAMA